MSKISLKMNEEEYLVLEFQNPFILDTDKSIESEIIYSSLDPKNYFKVVNIFRFNVTNIDNQHYLQIESSSKNINLALHESYIKDFQLITEKINKGISFKDAFKSIVGEYKVFKVLNEKYNNYDLLFYIDQNRLELRNQDFNVKEIILKIKNSDIVDIFETKIRANYSKKFGLIFGIIVWLGVGYYNYSRSLDQLEYIFSFVSGLFWGGIAYFIGYFFKTDMKVIRIILNQDYIDLDFNEELLLKLRDLKNNEIQNKFSKINTNETMRDNFEIKYDQLIKLKELLDKEVITQREFELEKAKLLSKE